MSNLKFYDNGSLAASGNVATGHSSNLLLGNCNVAAEYTQTYVVAPNAGDIMYIENGIYYFPQDIFYVNGVVESSPNAGSVILIHTPHSLYGSYIDFPPSYETSIFISTGDNPYKNSIIYYGFKLAEGPALTSAAGYFEWLTIIEESSGAIVNGVDNTSVGNNLVMGYDNRINGTYNTIMTQHANVTGNYNYISVPSSSGMLRQRSNFNGSANIIVSSTSLFPPPKGSDNYIHGFNTLCGNYNLVFGLENNSGKTDNYSILNGIIGEKNRNYGNRSLMFGSSGVLDTDTTSSTMGKLVSYNTNLGDYSYIIGTDNFNGLRGVRINTLQYTADSTTFSVTLRDKATFQNNVIYIFYYGSRLKNIYGKYNSSSTSDDITTYTFNRVNSSGNASTSSTALDYDFSSDTSPVYWHCVFPYGAPHVWYSGEGVHLPMNNTINSTTLATTPVNNLPLGGQVYGLGNIIIGHNNVNIGSRSILIGNDLGGNVIAGDKVVRIGNGIGVNYTGNLANYTMPSLSTGDYDGTSNSSHSRQVILENRFTDNEYNSTLSMTSSGATYVSYSHNFSCNSVSSTSNKIALNAPLTLSSTYIYGTSLPTDYLQSGRIFFLI